MSNVNRRAFLKSGLAAAVIPAFGMRGLDLIFPQKAYRVGLIGTGWYGKSDLFRLMQVTPTQIVALCDVDQNMLKEAATLIGGGHKPRLYRDYREMLQKEEMDIVLIGTPDHWHALQAIEAMKQGAHVYLQKPVSLDVLEGEAVLAAARKYKRVVQIGTQRRSTPHLIDAKENIIEAGLLGKVAHVEVFCYYHMRMNTFLKTEEIPDYLDYDLWTGPAAMRTYQGLPHRRWRAFQEYGNGIMGDMCVHMLDTVRWMLGLGWPTKISSTGGIFVQKNSSANIPDTQTAIFEFPELTCVWNHRTWGRPVDPEYPWGFKIYGEKGTLSGSVYQYDFVPYSGGQPIHKKVIYEREQFPADLVEKDIELHTAPATRYHMLDFLKAIEQNTNPVASIEEGHISSASCILANISLQLNRPLKYDPELKGILGDAEADLFLKRNYRSGWEHPFDKI